MIAFLLFTYLFLLNVSTFTLYSVDKFKSQTGQARISEKSLMALAIAGGAYGAGMAMLLFRHKTLHRNFRIVVPVSFVLWMLVIVLLCLFF
jgi:uncharacterized membrane protein YsdA (DUF1294 family)